MKLFKEITPEMTYALKAMICFMIVVNIVMFGVLFLML